MDSLRNKKVIILGGSSGIGLAVAKAVSADGAEVTIVSSNQERIDSALEQLPKSAKGRAVNLADEDQIATLFNTIDKFDHLLFTAGENLQINSIANTSLSDAKNFFEVRFWGAFAAVKYAAPNINPGGSIVLTGGCAAHRPGSGWSLVASVFSAMEGFVRAMAIELAPIRVSLVVPGLVKTELWAGMDTTEREEMFVHFSKLLPVKYVAPAEDVSETYLHLIKQKYITGQTVIVDGGFVLV